MSEKHKSYCTSFKLNATERAENKVVTRESGADCKRVGDGVARRIS